MKGYLKRYIFSRWVYRSNIFYTPINDWGWAGCVGSKDNRLPMLAGEVGEEKWWSGTDDDDDAGDEFIDSEDEIDPGEAKPPSDPKQSDGAGVHGGVSGILGIGWSLKQADS